MRLFISKEGLRGSLGPVRRWRYYLVAVFGPVALVAATVGISVATGLSEFSLGSDKPFSYVPLLLVVGTPISAVLAFGEEYGWRGYLLPKLLPLGEVKASVIVALIWDPWHLPILLAGLSYVDKDPLAVLAVMTAMGIGLSLLFTWLFVAAGGSVLVAAFMHGSLNSFTERFSDSAHLSGNPFVVSVYGLVGFGVTAVAVLLAYQRRRPAAADRPRPVTAVPAGRTAGSAPASIARHDGVHSEAPPGL
jgi:membrane protease YdiL (CAAX protease family)